MNKLSDNMLEMQHRVSGPAFRWKIAKGFANSQRTVRSQSSDEQIQQATAYLRMCEEVSREQADFKYPTLAAACRLAENEESFQLLKLSILGILPRAETAARLGINQQFVEVAEALFFDVDELRQASGWMNCHVFIPEAKFGSKELAAKMKIAHYGGPVVARALLDGHEKLPLDEAQQIIDQDLQLHAKLQVALQFDLDARSAQEFLKVFFEYDLQRKKLEFEREKFHLKCALALEQRTAGEVDRKDKPSNDAARRQQNSSEENQVPPTGIDSVGDEQLAA
jgi:hypothetical protein